MKDSGIEWIGAIPAHWKTLRLKYTSTLKGRIGWQGLRTDEYIEEGPYLITGTDFDNGVINWDSCVHVSEGRFNQDINIQIKEDDLLVTKDGTIGKVAIALNCPEKVSLNSGVFIVRNNKAYKYIDKFLYYVILSNEFLFWYDLSQHGNSTIKHLTQENFYEFSFAYPPLNEQKRIASFLDSKCSKIDETLNEISEQIIVLEKYKKSVISEAVSKGLNSAKLKESGMGWIKSIPQNWSISRIASVYKLRNTKVNDRDYPPLSVTMKGIVPQLESAAKTDAHDDRKLVCKGDFAINSRSDRRGSCGISPCDGSISLINIVLCPLRNMDPGYYNWLFHTIEFADEFYKCGHGIVDDLWTTGWQEMKNIIIPQPPLAEQKAISSYLDKKCSEIDSAIQSKKDEFDALMKYKESLIYEYVTGKKEAPNE